VEKQSALGEPERAEGSRPLSILLGIIGVCAMLVVMWMTARYGWSLQDDIADRSASAALNILVDPAAAALAAASGSMLKYIGWRKVMGVIAVLISLILVGYSIISVYGFMSTRIAHLEAQKKVVEMQLKDFEWKRATSINRYVPKSERAYLRQESQAAYEDLKRSLTFVPDAAASSIAAIFGTTVEKVQRALVLIGSCVGQLINVSCLFFGSILWPRRQQPGGGSLPADGGGGLMVAVDNAAAPRQDTGKLSSCSPTLPATGRWNTADVPATARDGIGSLTGVFISVRAASGTLGMPAVRKVRVAGTRLRGQRLPKEIAAELDKAADWFVAGASSWPSIRTLGEDLGVHHKTAGDYVRRAEQRAERRRRLQTAYDCCQDAWCKFMCARPVGSAG
jgi:hypothetical protein